MIKFKKMYFKTGENIFFKLEYFFKLRKKGIDHNKEVSNGNSVEVFKSSYSTNKGLHTMRPNSVFLEFDLNASIQYL